MDSFAERVLFAFLLLSLRGRTGDRLTHQALADRMSKRIGRSISQPAITRYLSGRIPQEEDVMLALALELGVDPGWLYFGPKYSQAPPPVDPALEKIVSMKTVAKRTRRSGGGGA